MNRIKLGIIVLLVVSMGACKITRTVTGSSESRIHPDEFKANEESGWEGLKILKLKGADLVSNGTGRPSDYMQTWELSWTASSWHQSFLLQG